MSAIEFRYNMHFKEFLNDKLALRADLVRTLGSGEGISARWWRLGGALQQLGFKISLDDLQDVEASANTGPRRAEEFLCRIGGRLINTRTFIAALRLCLLERLADEFECAVRGEASLSTQQAAPNVSIQIGSITSSNPPLDVGRVDAVNFSPTISSGNMRMTDTTAHLASESAERTDHADVFYNGEYYAVIRVPRSLKIEDDQKTFSLPCTVDFIKGKKRAGDEADARYDREIQRVGGDENEARVEAGFVVLAVSECFFPKPKEIKSRRRENPRAAAAAAPAAGGAIGWGKK